MRTSACPIPPVLGDGNTYGLNGLFLSLLCFLLLAQYGRKLCHHGQRCTVAPIANAPYPVDEDLAGTAAGEVHAVIAMIQINVEPKTCVIALYIVRARQRPEGTVVQTTTTEE